MKFSMKTPAGVLFSVVATLALFADAFPSAERAERTKFIAFAWEFNSDSPEVLLRYADAFDKTPLDGIGINLMASAVIDGKRVRCSYYNFMHDPAWPKEAFAKQIPHLRELAKHRSMRHSFLSSLTAPYERRIDWMDDAEWARIAESMRTVAWVAKESGLKGMKIDPEDYRKLKQFSRRAGEAPYDELCEIVRRRGRELFAPVFEEYPDITLHFFWFFSHLEHYTKYDRADVTAMCRADENLWPAFLNGILDVLPPGAVITDGDEDGYHHTAAKNGFRNGAYMFHSLYPQLVAPENLDKYRRQVRYAPPIYTAMYTSKEGANWYKPPTEGSRLETLRRDLIQASDVSGGYVWFWTETHPWVKRAKNWKRGDPRILDTTLPEALPGLFEVMEWVKNPVAFYDRKVAELSAKGQLVNLAETDSVSVSNGYKTVSLKNVKGGEYYGIAFDVASDASARVNVFVRNAKGKYVQPSINMIYPRDGRGVVRIPEGGARGTIVFSARNPAGKKTVFENLRVYRLFREEKPAKADPGEIKDKPVKEKNKK